SRHRHRGPLLNMPGRLGCPTRQHREEPDPSWRVRGWLVLLFALLPLLLSLPLLAQDLSQYDYEDLEFRGIGADGGMVWPARVESANYYGIRVDLGFVGPRVRVVPVARFWSSRLVDE